MGSTKKRVQYRYDAVGNRSLMIDPDGGRFTYAYDSMKQIKTVQNPQGDRTTFSYDNDGRRTLKLLANGTRASFIYDDANNMTTLANLKSDSSVISKFDYQYDNVGNRTSVVEADDSRVTWTYDNTYQLTAEHRAGTSPYRNTFTYDKNGNRLVKNENNARTTYAYDAANQLKISVDDQGTTTYTYDNDGNQELVQAPTGARTTTTWDYENKTTLVQLPSGTRNTMSYEPDGLRVKLEDSTGTKKFIWDDQTYLTESDENNDTNAVYTNEPSTYGNLISQHRKSGAIWLPSYYHQEALGSARELTDSIESVTDTYVYDAWGNLLSSTGTTINPFQWTGNVGYYFDADTGNFYIRARNYSPAIGRWLSVDPFGFIDGMNLFTAYFVPNSTDASGMYTKKTGKFDVRMAECNSGSGFTNCCCQDVSVAFFPDAKQIARYLGIKLRVMVRSLQTFDYTCPRWWISNPWHPDDPNNDLGGRTHWHHGRPSMPAMWDDTPGFGPAGGWYRGPCCNFCSPISGEQEWEICAMGLRRGVGGFIDLLGCVKYGYKCTITRTGTANPHSIFPWDNNWCHVGCSIDTWGEGKDLDPGVPSVLP